MSRSSATTAEAEAEAEGLCDELAGEVGQCADQGSTRRASAGKRHDLDLDGISQTRWRNIRGVVQGDPMRGVLVITDPAKTTDILPLMRQGGLRMV